MRASTIFLSGVAFAGAALSLWLAIELRTERARADALSVRLQENSVPMPMPLSTPAPEPARPLRARDEPPPTRSPAAAVTSSNDSLSRPARRVPATSEEWMQRQRQLMNDPQYREAWYEQQRLQMTARRDKIKEYLQLTDEQADAIIDLNIDRMLTWQFQTAPDPANQEEMRERRERAEEAQRVEESRLREVLGDSKFAQYQEYLASSPSRQQVSRLQSELSGADALRDDQIEPLIAAMHAEQTRMTKDLQAFHKSLSWENDASAAMQKMSERQTEEMKAFHARLRKAAGGILSFSQLEQLDVMLERDVARHKAQERMQRIQQKWDTPAEMAASPR
jgi:hypothetical protein